MISDDDIEKALDFMRDNAESAAQAAANVVTMQEGVKTALAMGMAQSTAPSAARAEVDARLTRQHKLAVEAHSAAVYNDRKWRLLYAAAEAKIEAWRTMNANRRGQL